MDRRTDAGRLRAGRGLVRAGPATAGTVQGADASPIDEPGPSRLLRVSADGRCTRVRTQDRIRSVQAEPEDLLVAVDAPPWTLRHLGVQTYEVSWATRWLRLPWDAEVPEVMTLDSHGVPDTGSAGAPAPTVRYDDGGRLYNHWYDATCDPDDPDVEPVAALGLRWHLGWSPVARRPAEPAVAAGGGQRP